MRRKALCLLRKDIVYRREAFLSGLNEAGFDVVEAIAKPKAGDVLVIWNRYGDFDVLARQFEAAGATVVVTENGWLGKRWRGEEWFTLCGGHHAGAGTWAVGDAGRWDGWAVPLDPWRIGGKETVILGQRGIGEPGIASPPRWDELARAWYGGRIRPHPGQKPSLPIEEDLAEASQVLTWNSGGALKALMMGVPVRCDFPRWIGMSAACPMQGDLRRSDSARLAMFRRLAWAMWTLEEIRSGVAFRHFFGNEHFHAV